MCAGVVLLCARAPCARFAGHRWWSQCMSSAVRHRAGVSRGWGFLCCLQPTRPRHGRTARPLPPPQPSVLCSLCVVLNGAPLPSVCRARICLQNLTSLLLCLWRSVAWSADGAYLAIGTSDAKVQIWDACRMKQVRSGVWARRPAWRGSHLLLGREVLVALPPTTQGGVAPWGLPVTLWLPLTDQLAAAPSSKPTLSPAAFTGPPTRTRSGSSWATPTA